MNRHHIRLLLLLIAVTATPHCFGDIALQRRLRQSRHGSDMAKAVLRQRARTMATPSIDQLSTFKGFVYEQSLLRRRQQSAAAGVSYDFAKANDEIADLVRSETDGRRVGIQVYGGMNTKLAFEKLIGSDAAADELIVPRDIHAKMKAMLREAEAVFSRHQEGTLDTVTARRLITKRLKGSGLTLSPDGFEIGMNHKGLRHQLGPLGTGATSRVLGKLKPDTKTSTQIYRDSIKGLLDPTSDTSLGRLARNLNLTSDANVSGVMALFDERVRFNKRRGYPHHLAARKAHHWLRRSTAPKISRVIEREQRRALALGVTFEDLEKIRKQLTGHGLDQRAGQLTADLRSATRKIALKQQRIGNGIAAVFLLVGAGADFYVSGDSVQEWLTSDSARQWGARGGMTSAIVSASIAMERKLIAEGSKQSAKRGAGQLIQRIGSSTAKRAVVIGGVAGSLFIAGESLIQILAYDRSFAEVSGQLYESVVVMAVSEAAGIGASLLIAGETGTLGGPIGIAVAVGLAATYEGVKYVWTSRRQLSTSTKILMIRCNHAQRKYRNEYLKLANQRRP